MTGVPAGLQDALGGRYVLRRELARGGMATVYLARDVKHQRDVAVKVLSADVLLNIDAERFRREIAVIASLRHPHIVPLFDSGEVDGQQYYVMPLITGESLRDRIARDRQLPILDVRRITRDVAAALEYAHRHGVVHRDVKPANVLLEDEHAVVADFGIARRSSIDATDRLTTTGMFVGTPAYMSPEQVTGAEPLDARTDVYSLGCVVFEMLTGHPPYTARSSQGLLAQHMTSPTPSATAERAGLPSEVDLVLERALAKDPAARFSTVRDFADAAESALGRTAHDSRRPATHASAAHFVRHRRTITLGIAIGTAVVVLSAIPIAWWQRSTRKADAAALRGIALLPCENASDGPDVAGLGDRYGEELIHKLVRVAGLQPKSWASVRRYKGTSLTPSEIARELNAGTVGRCVVGEKADGVHLTVELIRGRDDRVIWSDSYHQPLNVAGIDAAQTAAAREIARQLGVIVSGIALEAVARPITRDSAALRLYRLGRHFQEQIFEPRDPATARKSIEHFRAALARDSTFAQAYVALAEAMFLLAEMEATPSQSWYPMAAGLAKRALSMDSTIAEAHSFLADYALVMTHDWPGAEEEHRLALESNPSSVEVQYAHGFYLMSTERPSSAIAAFERAKELDPISADARGGLLQMYRGIGDTARLARELSEALQVRERRSGFYHFAADLFIRRGRPDSAVAILNKLPRTTWNGWLYALAGRRDSAQRILDSMLVLNATRPVDPLHLAVLQVSVGNTSEALDLLDRAHAERSPGLVFHLSRSLHVFDGLRNAPRFQALRKKVGFVD
jgi:eukaryotic-like serine/threonine-protein kinase